MYATRGPMTGGSHKLIDDVTELLNIIQHFTGRQASAGVGDRSLFLGESAKREWKENEAIEAVFVLKSTRNSFRVL